MEKREVEERFAKASELLEEKEFLEELSKAENDAQVQKLFADRGVELSTEDIAQMCKQSAVEHDKDELSAEDMDQVAGGIVITLSTAACFAMGSAALGFYTSYGWRTIKSWRR